MRVTFAFVRALGDIYELAEPTEGLDNTRKRRPVSFTLASGRQRSNQSSKIDDFQQFPASIERGMVCWKAYDRRLSVNLRRVHMSLGEYVGTFKKGV